jgi:hypothetical protein
MNNKEKKKLLFETVKELVRLQGMISDKSLAHKLNSIITRISNGTLDFQNGMNYISINQEKAKKQDSKIFWARVIQIMKKYFEEVNK